MSTPSIPVVPIVRTTDHPRFAGGTDLGPDIPAPKKVDTEAARTRVTAARSAAKASDKPPTRRKERENGPAAVSTPYTIGMYRGPITTLYAQGGNLLSYVAYPVGQAVVTAAPTCGEAWSKVANQNPAVRRFLGKATGTGAWGELFFAHLPILMTAVMVYGPAGVKERMGNVMTESMEQMTTQTSPNGSSAAHGES